MSSRRANTYLAYDLLHYDDKAKAQSQFSPASRRDGWEKIERWAFRVNAETMRIMYSPNIEPAYHLNGLRVVEVWSIPPEPLP